MDVREKLVELLTNSPQLDVLDCATGWEEAANYLIANGVTVQDGKPLDAFLHPVDAYKGLKSKYLVFKADTGERVGNCFVLRPDKDHAAVEAIRAYASATDNETLAEDIYNWVGKCEPVQEWISVDDRLPKPWKRVLIYSRHDFYESASYIGIPGKWRVTWNHEMLDDDSVTHWMPLPEKPKGE